MSFKEAVLTIKHNHIGAESSVQFSYDNIQINGAEVNQLLIETIIEERDLSLANAQKCHDELYSPKERKWRNAVETTLIATGVASIGAAILHSYDFNVVQSSSELIFLGMATTLAGAYAYSKASEETEKEHLEAEEKTAELDRMIAFKDNSLDNVSENHKINDAFKQSLLDRNILQLK